MDIDDGTQIAGHEAICRTIARENDNVKQLNGHGSPS
jgi:hypothetical protein